MASNAQKISVVTGGAGLEFTSDRPVAGRGTSSDRGPIEEELLEDTALEIAIKRGGLDFPIGCAFE
jgi:hypothetical protein